jgi:hypothetical protein
MQSYQRFIFDSYELNTKKRTIQLRYSLDDAVTFTETITLPPDIGLLDTHPDLDAALFALHLSGGASYYKTCLPKTIEVRSGRLDETQAAFWNKLYTHGLGQFFYENQINFHGLINFPVSVLASAPRPTSPAQATATKVLVPFGGGKDSIVTSELLKTAGTNQTLFRLRSHKLITKLAGIADLPLITAERALAPELFELNASGALNGHVPITAHISFLTIVIGLLGGFDSICFSNERSSSYGNVSYRGIEVNHQWSKSLEAQLMLTDYIRSFVTTAVSYDNPLRPLSELHIAKLFARYPRYLGTATSCNRNWSLTLPNDDAPRWCCECPKCAFSFALLAAFLPLPQIVAAFGKNLFEDSQLLPLYRELWGVEGFKPFECVGTPEETNAAFYLTYRNNPNTPGPVMREFISRVLPTMSSPDKLVKQLLTPETSQTPPHIVRLLTSAGVL